jgi:hypothetical protein
MDMPIPLPRPRHHDVRVAAEFIGQVQMLADAMNGGALVA